MFRRLRLRVRRAWLDIRHGACSGFPSCCIAFFTLGWRPFQDGQRYEVLSDMPRWRQRAVRWYLKRSGLAGYIPCPLCMLSGARVRVRNCDDSCGHLKESRAMAEAEQRVRRAR